MRTDTVGNRGVVINGESGGEYTHSRNSIGKMSQNSQAMKHILCYNIIRYSIEGKLVVVPLSDLDCTYMNYCFGCGETNLTKADQDRVTW